VGDCEGVRGELVGMAYVGRGTPRPDPCIWEVTVYFGVDSSFPRGEGYVCCTLGHALLERAGAPK